MSAEMFQECHDFSTLERSSRPLARWKLLSRWILQVFNIFETNHRSAIGNFWTSQKGLP
jgi:hypothetical protein